MPQPSKPNARNSLRIVKMTTRIVVQFWVSQTHWRGEGSGQLGQNPNFFYTSYWGILLELVEFSYVMPITVVLTELLFVSIPIIQSV